MCLTGDLTRQCEIDLFQAEIPDRFIHARDGRGEHDGRGRGARPRRLTSRSCTPSACSPPGGRSTRSSTPSRIPGLPVRIVGFMPGVSSPGGPSHQAIDDVALMRALPEHDRGRRGRRGRGRPGGRAPIADLPGPVYVRLKRGEIPVIFADDHRASPGPAPRSCCPGHRRRPARQRHDARRRAGRRAGCSSDHGGLVSRSSTSRSIKPLDTATVLAAAAAARVVVTAENHTIIGGLGSAVAETLAEAGLGRPLRRVGLQRHLRRRRPDRPVPVRQVRPVHPGRSWTRPGPRSARRDPAPVAESPRRRRRVRAGIARRPAGIQS